MVADDSKYRDAKKWMGNDANVYEEVVTVFERQGTIMNSQPGSIWRHQNLPPILVNYELVCSRDGATREGSCALSTSPERFVAGEASCLVETPFNLLSQSALEL
jgi:hypothetical protein